MERPCSVALDCFCMCRIGVGTTPGVLERRGCNRVQHSGGPKGDASRSFLTPRRGVDPSCPQRLQGRAEPACSHLIPLTLQKISATQISPVCTLCLPCRQGQVEPFSPQPPPPLPPPQDDIKKTGLGSCVFSCFNPELSAAGTTLSEQKDKGDKSEDPSHLPPSRIPWILSREWLNIRVHCDLFALCP